MLSTFTLVVQFDKYLYGHFFLIQIEKLPLPDILAIQVTEKWVEVNPLDPESDWHLISPYHITPESSMNRGDDHQLLIVKQILPVSLFGNVWRTVWRICILMLGCKGFKYKPSGLH